AESRRRLPRRLSSRRSAWMRLTRCLSAASAMTVCAPDVRAPETRAARSSFPAGPTDVAAARQRAIRRTPRRTRGASGAGRGPIEVGEELRPRPVARAEQAQDRRGGHHGARLAHAAHDGAEMGRLDHHADALWVEPVL